MIPSSHIMMTNPTLPSSSSFTCDWTYDVFLNFRGVDTRHNFTGNLYNSLCQKGIQTFIDDEGLNKGEEIKPALLSAIKESRIFIAIFSKNYASSTYCLDELVMMLECSKAQERLLLPVFYDVEPTHVRHQSGTYAEAMAQHEKQFQDDKGKIKVKKWREALTQAANMSGWHFQHGTQEYIFIGKIIDEVSEKINRIPLHVANNPVGLESVVQEVTSLLGLGPNEGVNMVGIYGIGGIGKSTIARAVYNLIADQFEGLCFLANIKEKATRYGLEQLQETLLFELLGEKDIKVGDVHRGIPLIKRRLNKKKVLLILDDVDKLNQLQALAGGHEWFGSNSKIIITTRNKHLLASHGIVNLYEVKQLTDKNARELFSWCAFKCNFIDPSYGDISKRAIIYAHGLPLALEVIGSNLYGKSLNVWKSALDKYERIPHKEIYNILKVSYDDLEEEEKGIFLDIACFFNSHKIRYVKEILYLHDFHAEVGIQVLIDKSLMKIDRSGCVRMHDLIQDMGREIVRQESTFEPGKRSRLWFSKDIIHILEGNTGTDTIEVIIVDLGKAKEVQWSGIAFKKMKNLRILIIENGGFSIGPQVLPNSLRVLDWSGYPSPTLPSDFNPKNLVLLNVPESCLKLFKPMKVFESLSFMNFDGCKFLTQIPNLSRVPYLVALCLDDCTNLIRIDDSVGFLDKLVLLTAQRCTKLEILVPCIYLTSLETLDLRGCSSLWNFPEVLGAMENIIDVYLDQTAITVFPDSIENLVGLQRLFLRECHGLRLQLPNTIHLLHKVEIIMAYGCRGFQLSKDKEKVSSEVLPKAMCIYGTDINLDVYSRNMNPNNIIQVGACFFNEEYTGVIPTFGRPFRFSKVNMDLPFVDARVLDEFFWTMSPADIEFFYQRLLKGRVNWCKLGSKESSIKFWFRKKFPKIALWCAGGPNMYNNKNVVFMDFKLSVHINGAKQFTSSCNFIFSVGTMKEQILCCDLQCEVEQAFPGHDWNEVEILCELDFPRPCDSSERVMEIPKLSLIYVYKENKKEDVKFKNHELPFSSFLSQEQEYSRMANVVYSLLTTQHNCWELIQERFKEKVRFFYKELAKEERESEKSSGVSNSPKGFLNGRKRKRHKKL